MIDEKLLIDEIDRRIKAIEKIKLNDIAGRDELIYIKGFIDSLQEEPISKQKLSNVERTVKNWKKEPVSEELEEELDKYIHDNFTIEKDQLDKFEIEEKDYMYSMDKGDMLAMVRHFANWQKAKDSTCASEDLDKAAKEWLIPQLDKSYEPYGERKMMELTRFDGYAMLDAIEFGAKWKKEEMIKVAIDVEVKVDAGGYPYIPQMELYDYDKDVPLAKEGDRYKVILIKE